MGRSSTYTAGVAMYRRTGPGPHNIEVLLVHPTGGPAFGCWSIPKGHSEPGETAAQTAERETLEETGVGLKPGTLRGYPGRIRTKKKLPLVYWVLDVSKDGIPSVIPEECLPLQEVDAARFVPLAEAMKRVSKRQRPILNQIARETQSPWGFTVW